MKLRSSMTLFHRAVPDDPVFGAVLDRYFDGVPDEATICCSQRRGNRSAIVCPRPGERG